MSLIPFYFRLMFVAFRRSWRTKATRSLVTCIVTVSPQDISSSSSPRVFSSYSHQPPLIRFFLIFFSACAPIAISGIILWELLVRKCPYEGKSAIQCALAVLNDGLRPEIPKWYVNRWSLFVRKWARFQVYVYKFR